MVGNIGHKCTGSFLKRVILTMQYIIESVHTVIFYLCFNCTVRWKLKLQTSARKQNLVKYLRKTYFSDDQVFLSMVYCGLMVKSKYLPIRSRRPHFFEINISTRFVLPKLELRLYFVNEFDFEVKHFLGN